MKVICGLKGWAYPQGARATDLVKIWRREGLFPEFAELSFDQLVATLKSCPSERSRCPRPGSEAGRGANVYRLVCLEFSCRENPSSG